MSISIMKLLWTSGWYINDKRIIKVLWVLVVEKFSHQQEYYTG